jgi:hypothetical protein
MSQLLCGEGVLLLEFLEITQNSSTATRRGDARWQARGSVSDEEQARSENRRGSAPMMAIGHAMIEDEDAKGLEGFLTNPIFG